MICQDFSSSVSCRLLGDFGNKMQICTQRYGKRPYGVGLLVAGYDDNGPHIYQTCPSANYYGKHVCNENKNKVNIVAKHFVICL